ncbi:MAG: hypothetical protein BGO49_23880 [Planctomycetales bacterium 71-10]|nr:MAG: hypothetical protein BGO49_23880 [Planctomycetales bacterium 71-10]
MTIRPRSTWAVALLALAAVAPARGDEIVNIDANHYGYQESPVIPSVGEAVSPISTAPGGFLQRTLTAGVYQISNAVGDPQALYDAFKFNQATSGETWTWNFLITNADDGNKAVLFGNGSGLAATQADAAANAAGYVGYFTLTTTSTLNFMISDYAVGDNTGGVSLRITPLAVPEPAALAMMALGALLPAVALARRRSA